MNLGYIQVSKTEKNVALQKEELRKYDIEDCFIFIDKVSRNQKADNRPQYEALKEVLRPGDTLYIHQLTQLGRNNAEISEELQQLKQMKIIIRILDLPTTMIGVKPNKQKPSFMLMETVNNLLVEVMSVIAENELKKTRKRQSEGIVSAKRKGVKFGRPPIQFPDNFPVIYGKWKSKKITGVKAMKLLNLKKTSFYKLVKIHENNKPAKLTHN